MGSGNPSVELAPLRGSIEFNLDAFEELESSINDLKDNLEDLSSNIEFTSNIDNLVEQFGEFINKLHDIDHSFNFTSNIEKFEEQIDKINDELKDKTFVIKIKSDLGAFNSKLDKLKDSLGDDNFQLNINSNLPDVLSQVQELKEEINTMPSIKIDTDISKFGNQLEKVVEFNEQEIEFLQSLGATVEKVQGNLEHLALNTEEATGEMRSSFDETMSSADDLKLTLSRLEIRLGSLRYMADIKGNLTVEGITSTLGELDELQSEVANVMKKVESLDNTFDITGEDFDEITSRCQELSNAIFDLQEKVSGLGERSKVTRVESESLGKEWLEAGQNALWNGQMISSMMSPIRTVGEKMFELGLKTSSALTISTHMFGKNAIQVNKWSKTTVETMGLAQGAALSTAEQFGMSARTLGANKKQAALLAEGYTQLAQHIDLGTQGTISYQTAASACLQAMAGQTYGLKALGISFSTSNENAEAAALGYHKAYKSLSPVQQATVRLKLAQKELNEEFGTTKEDLNTNYGQWAKTKAQLEETGEVMGEQLVPIIMKGAKVIEKLTSTFSKLTPVEKDAVLGVMGLVAAAGPLIETYSLLKLIAGGVRVAFEKLSGKALTAGKDMERTGEVIKDSSEVAGDSLNLLSLAFNPITLAIGAALIAGGALYEAWKHNFLGIKTFTLKTWKDIKRDFHDSINDIKNSVKNWWDTQKQLWENGYKSLKSSATSWWDTQKVLYEKQFEKVKHTWDQCKSVTIEAWHHITSSVSHALHTMFSDIEKTPFGQGIAKIAHSIERLVRNCKNAIVDIIQALVHAVWHRFENMGEQVEQIGHNIAQRFERLWNRIKTDTENAMESIKNAFDSGWSSLCGWFATNVGQPAEYVGEMLQRFGSHIESGISEARQVFASGWSSLCGWFDGAVQGPVNSVESMGSSFESTMSSVMASVSSAFQSGWSSLCGWFSGASQEIVTEAESLGSAMVSAGENIMNDLLSGLTNGWYAVTNWVSSEINGLANRVSSAASHIVSDITSWGNDGSHATGLAYVPWDGYRAELHKGEMVLTAEQAENYRQGNNGTSGNTYNFYSPEPIDPFEAKRQMIDASRKLANGFY